MIREYIKKDGTRVLQQFNKYYGGKAGEWQDIPVEYEEEENITFHMNCPEKKIKPKAGQVWKNPHHSKDTYVVVFESYHSINEKKTLNGVLIDKSYRFYGGGPFPEFFGKDLRCMGTFQELFCKIPSREKLIELANDYGPAYYYIADAIYDYLKGGSDD